MFFPPLSLHIEPGKNSLIYLQHCSVPLPVPILVCLALPSSYHQARYTRGDLPWIILSLTYAQSSEIPQLRNPPLLNFQFFFCSNNQSICSFPSEACRLTSARDINPLQWHHLLLLLSTLWCSSPTSCISHFSYVLQTLAFPTKYLLHAAIDTSFAACSSAFWDVLTCWLKEVFAQIPLYTCPPGLSTTHPHSAPLYRKVSQNHPLSNSWGSHQPDKAICNIFIAIAFKA